MKEIPITKGKVAIVDDADFDLVMGVSNRWHAVFVHGVWYARRTRREDGRHVRVSMHRLIMNAHGSLCVDHIDGNGLNNQRCNLRLCTPAQNKLNSRKRRDGFKGVEKINAWWRAAIKINGTTYRSSGHSTELEAAHAYDVLAREHHGEFARLNFPDHKTVSI